MKLWKPNASGFLIISAIALLAYRFYPPKYEIDEVYVSFDISPDGTNIVFCSQYGDLFEMDLKTQHVEMLLEDDNLKSNPTYSPDGKRIVYSSSNKKRDYSYLYELHLENKIITQLTKNKDSFDSYPSFSPDGSQITFARAHRNRPYSLGGWTWDQWDIYIINSNGENLSRITKKNYYEGTHPCISPDGKMVLYTATGTDVDNSSICMRIVRINNSSEPVKLVAKTMINNPKKVCTLGSEPDISQNSNQVVFIADWQRPHFYNLFIMDIDGSNLIPLNVLEISRYNSSPVFSPDGKSVYYLAGTSSDSTSKPIYSLAKVNSDGTHCHIIANEQLFLSPLKLFKPTD